MGIDFYHISMSPPCRSIILTAAALDLELNFKKVDMQGGEHKSPEYLKMNPLHTIPTIDDDGFFVYESRAIMTYLCDAYGKDDSLYPKDVKQRTVINQRLFFDLEMMFGRTFAIMYPIAFCGCKEMPEEKRAKLEESMGWLDGFLSESEWAAGDTMTIADIALFVSTTCLEVFGFDFSGYEHMSAWFGKCKESIPGLDCAEYQEGLQKFTGFMRSKIEESGVEIK